MLLNNFSNILSAKLTYGNSTTMGDKVNYIKTTDGTIYENKISTNDVYFSQQFNNNNQGGIKFALSNDENEIDYYDYKINNCNQSD